jgi:hypothetical protein
MRQGLIAGAVAVAAAVLVAVGWTLWPRPAAVTAPSAAASTRSYLDTSACLLTGTEGVTPGTADARVWQGLESASAASAAKANPGRQFILITSSTGEWKGRGYHPNAVVPVTTSPLRPPTPSSSRPLTPRDASTRRSPPSRAPPEHRPYSTWSGLCCPGEAGTSGVS